MLVGIKLMILLDYKITNLLLSKQIYKLIKNQENMDKIFNKKDYINYKKHYKISLIKIILLIK